MSSMYKQAGVDIDAGNALVETIKPVAATTAIPGVMGALGGFGSLFDLKAAGFEDPILVSGTDGVGTKLKIAIESGQHETIGIDLVAMCANDILAQGATPLFFLDYFACGKLEPQIVESVIQGIAQGCRLAGAALIGGETAEMPGMYRDGDYDIAGFCVGAVERRQLLPKHTGSEGIKAGDYLIALPSSGAHSNGFSLIRQIVAKSGLSWDAPAPFAPSQSLAEAFLTPTRLYVKALKPLLKADLIKGFAHITGGGLTDNLPRILPPGLVPRLDTEQSGSSGREMPPVFAWLQKTGEVSEADMIRTFNCGIGGVIICRAAARNAVLHELHEGGENPRIIGILEEEYGQQPAPA